MTTTFDLAEDTIPSFASLQDARVQVFSSQSAKESLERTLESLGTEAEAGRRKGLGMWILGRYEDAAQLLASHTADDVASFTLAMAYMQTSQWDGALGIFNRLSTAYPEEPRPRAGALEARLEKHLGSDAEPEEYIASLRAEIAETPEAFQQSADGLHITGRLFEAERDWESALEAYEKSCDVSIAHRKNLFHLARLSERMGLDEGALEAYQALVALQPAERNAMMNLGILYEDMGRHQEAASCYDSIVKSAPMDELARLYLADALAGMEMYYDEDLERKEDRLNQILRTPITDFELSVRARNCLNKMDILTLGDLVEQTEAELLAYKNFGETSLNEIKEILGSKGLLLGMPHEEAVASVDVGRNRYTGMENADALNRPLSDLELSIRARRAVETLGCLTLGDIIQHSEEELLGMPNFGQTSLVELRERLEQFGLKLKSKPDSTD
ncbi:MAG: tetratricopeptide repeat protein [Planctomycetota bacterium]|nr:tetratricopeptide repeat protein [Planctomycetota bacterium]